MAILHDIYIVKLCKLSISMVDDMTGHCQFGMSATTMMTEEK